MIDVQDVLGSLRGCQIRLVRFASSHDRMVFRIRKSEEEDLYLVLIFCEEICVKPLWILSDPRVRAAETPGEFIFEDGAHFVRCQELHLQPKPPAWLDPTDTTVRPAG